MRKFNSALKDFVDQIGKFASKEQREKIEKNYTFEDMETDIYVKSFFENCKKLGDDISNRDEIVFSEENILLEHINFYELWNSNLSEENKENIWKHLQTLYIYSYEDMKQKDVKAVLKHMKNFKNNREKLDPDTQTLLNIIDSLSEKYSNNKYDASEETEGGGGVGGGFSFEPPELLNGMIGDLAKEIAEDIDTSKLNLDNPGEILQDLLSGNFDEEKDDTGLTHIVKNITEKIHTKLSDGSLNQDALFKEAQSVVSSFKNMSQDKSNPINNMMGSLFENMNNGNLDTPDLSEMMNAMPNNMANIENLMSKMNNDPNLKKMMGGKVNTKASNNSLQINSKKQKQKDRLKKKLQEKREELEKKEDELNKEVEDEIDIDKLAAEIENM